MKKIKGISASQRVGIGPAFVYRPATLEIQQYKITDSAAELERLETAIASVDKQLETLHDNTVSSVGAEEAEIFEVHRMLLTDPSFIDEIKMLIETEQTNAEAATDQVTANLVSEFEAIDDEYFRARATDIKDVGGQVVRQLLGIEVHSLEQLNKPSIIVANDLTPSDTALLDKSLVLGFCTEIGSNTSHTAILARSLDIPAVVGAGSLDIAKGELIVIDGTLGEIIIDPDADTIAHYEAVQQRVNQRRQQMLTAAREPAITVDGHQIEVVANIGSVAEAEQAIEMGAEGVGLLRTEFLFLERETLPTEEEQYEVYRAIADVFQQLPLIVRTLDVGGDKALPSIKMEPEMNPFLGQRAVRLSLARPRRLFQPQLRAILRAGHNRNIKIMFPMISSVDELQQALDQLDKAKKSLAADNLPFADSLEVGIMVEIPSAAVLTDLFAPMVDFFSIGTNDLAQYTLAVDRTNQQVAHLADPLHPAVIRLIKQVIDMAHKHRKWVGLCGEMAGDPLAIPLLLGLGLDEFSMVAPAIPPAKAQLRTLSVTQAKETAKLCLVMTDTKSVRYHLNNIKEQPSEKVD